MLAQEILALAHKGDPIAVGTYISYYAKLYGIKVRVQRQERVLHILMEASQPLQLQTAVDFVEAKLQELEIESIEAVIVYGRQAGQRLPDWQQRVQLQADCPAESPVPPLESGAAGEVSASLNSTPFREAAMPMNSEELPAPAPAQPMLPSALEPAADSAIPQSSELPDLLRRPEAVIFLIFVSFFVFWDAYLALVNGGTIALSSGQLARRLGTSRRAVRRMKRQVNFSEWTRRLDPDGIGWIYQKGVYVQGDA